MDAKPPITEHIRKDLMLEISGLLRKARYPNNSEAEAGGGKGAEDAAAVYREAMGLVKEFRKTATPKQLFSLLDIMKEFPHSEFGGEGGAVCADIQDSLIEQYRRKVFSFSGWGGRIAPNSSSSLSGLYSCGCL